MKYLTYQLYDFSTPYNGLLNFIKLLTNHQDIHSSGDITITVSSNNTDKIRDIRIPIGFENQEHNTYWCSIDEENSWYSIDFKSYSVQIESYVYRADEHDFFESWELLGSRDGENFESICKHYKSSAPTGKVKHLMCPQETKTKYNQIKLTHGKREFQSNQILAIYGIEFYGYLYD